MTRTATPALVAGLIVLSAVGGCQSQRARRIDEHLMAALGQARALHHLADVHLAQGEPGKAEAALRRIFVIRFPARAPERDDIVVDAYGRLAKLALGAGRLDEASATLEKGFQAAKKDTFYKAALYLIRGEIDEARAKANRQTGDVQGAQAASRRAIESYERSIEVNQRVLDRLGRMADREGQVE